MIDTMVEITKRPLSEAILNHLKMRTTGALLLTGDWGSGKTYHVKNYIFPLVKSKTNFTPVIVSLYGETDKNNIAQKVLFAYFDSKGKRVNLGTDTIAKNVKNISEAVPFIKKYVDIEKLILGNGENVFKLIPHDKLFICFDDIERMSKKINVNDFLGIINDLVENKGCKILLIGNEPEIRNGISYKEKTIEKTIHFLPNLSEIYDSVIAEYPDGLFREYLLNNKEFIIHSLTAEMEDDKMNNELKKSFSNIRTLKFAIEHFIIAFELLVSKNDDITDLINSQLRNLWVFTLSISIEFRKPNNISLTDRKKLDSQTLTISDFGRINLALSAQDTVEEKAEVENEWTYSENFKKIYYNRLSESYIFYEGFYNLITAGKQIDKEQFRKNIEEGFKIKEGKVNPAHKILDSFLRQGYWNYSDEEFVLTLKELLDYCEKGMLEDVISYLNAGVYLLGFSEIIGISREIITNRIKNGLDSILPKVNFNYFFKSQLEMVQGNFQGEHLSLLVDHIKQKGKEFESLKASEEAKRIQSLFESDLSAFAEEFLPENYDVRTPDKPFFHKLAKESVKKGIKNGNPKGIMSLYSLLKTRYLEISFSEYLIEEMKFLNELEEGISEIDLTKKTLSNHLIESQLIPRINECKNKLQEHIDRI